MDKLIEEGKKIFDIEIEALKKTRDSLDETFLRILNLIIRCTGKVIITGMGKPGHIASKMAATFSSLGTQSFFLHPGEAMHGDLGMVSKNDLVIAISYSGESDEIICIIPAIKMIGATLIGITGNGNSTLAQAADITQVFPTFKEACYLGLAPTASTTVTLCYGDALAIVASELYSFNNSDFGKIHPAGSLGKKLIMRVHDVMLHSEETAVVHYGCSLKEAICAMSKKGLSIVTALDRKKIAGILTDGDLRRLLENEADIYSLSFANVMTKKPTIIEQNTMAIDALTILRDNRFSSLPVIDENEDYKGIVTIQSIIKAGIVG